MKFSGKVGFWIGDVEDRPSVYNSQIIEKPYVCEVLRNTRNFQVVSDRQNSDLKVTARLSILSDLYMRNNWHSIKYVLWNGIKWEAKSVDISQSPRAIIELGDVYNESNIS